MLMIKLGKAKKKGRMISLVANNKKLKLRKRKYFSILMKKILITGSADFIGFHIAKIIL